jgi:ATP-binding cassette, subfamily B, bacterial IrtA/YbtP
LAATVVPFVGIVELGRVLLADGPVDASRVWTIVAVVIGALLVRTLASGTALTITHFADVDLQRSLRRRIVDTLGRLPLGCIPVRW